MVIEIKPAPARLWWVNQGSTFPEERSAGYVFAPLRGKNGQRVAHWEALRQLRRGDSILHYANGWLRSLSEVIEPCRIEHRPIVRPGYHSVQPGKPGYLVQVAYCDVVSPISRDEIPLEWRSAREGPFTDTGRVRQGYLYPLSELFKERFADTFGDRWPALNLPQATDR